MQPGLRNWGIEDFRNWRVDPRITENGPPEAGKPATKTAGKLYPPLAWLEPKWVRRRRVEGLAIYFGIGKNTKYML